MGLEVVGILIVRGWKANDRTCCPRSECPDGTYKVYGCDKPSVSLIQSVNQLVKCRRQGHKPDVKETDRLKGEYQKYSDLHLFDSDPEMVIDYIKLEMD